MDLMESVMANKKKITVLKVAAGIASAIIGVLCVGTVLLNSSSMQQRLLKHGLSMLSERLGTTVSADSVSVSVFKWSAMLYGLQINDQQSRPLITMGEADMSIAIDSWRERKVTIKSLNANHVKAALIQEHPDSAANYQFLIDAFSKDNKKDSEKKSHKLDINLKSVHFDDADVSYRLAEDENRLHLGELKVSALKEGYNFDIDSLNFKTDNHLPRKNAGNPNRGWFDAGHLDLVLSMRGKVNAIQDDNISVTVDDCSVSDKTAGLDVNGLHLQATASKKHVYLKNISLKQKRTTLSIDSATITLPDTLTGQEFAYKTSVITGHVILQDISRPFAPILKNFTVPLRLKTRMQGNAQQMTFTDVKVSTEDNTLTIAANGHINKMDKPLETTVSFDVQRMKTSTITAERIIKLFPVKRLMMDQLHRLKDITYTGHFDVLWRHESFMGSMATAAGVLNFQVSIDENTQWLTGTLSSNAFNLGKVLEINDLGNLSCNGEFKVDISRERTAKMRNDKNGKLPIGTAQISIDNCEYKKARVSDLDANVISDGAVAEGDVLQHGRIADISTHFAYTHTSDYTHLKLSDVHLQANFFKKKSGDKAKPGK